MLAMIASLDGRRAFGELDVAAWQAVTGDLRFADCKDAVILHYQESTVSLMPAHLFALTKRLRRERIGNRRPDLPGWIDVDDVARQVTYERAWLKAAGDGLSDVEASAVAETAARNYPIKQLTEA